MWGIPAFLFFFGFLHRVAPGVIVKEIMQAFNATGAIVGLLSAMYFWAYAGLMIPAAVLIDSAIPTATPRGAGGNRSTGTAPRAGSGGELSRI